MGFPLPWPHGYVPTVTTVAGTTLAYDTAYLEQGRDRLLHQFKGRPRLEAVQGVMLGQLQHIEVALWQLWAERRLSVATFETLRAVARRLGVRGYDTMPDSLLRRLCLAWIRVLRSDGNPEDLIAIVRLFTGSSSFALDPMFPASVIVRLGMGLTGEEAWLLGRLLRKAASAGVRIITEFPATQTPSETATPSRMFRFSTDPDADELNDDVGFADDGNTVGGFLAGATTGDE
jgi:hypothetical protein